MKRYIFLILVASTLFATALFGRTWENIKSSGTLNAGMRVRNGVLNENKETGFHYDLIKKFAEENGLKLNLVIIENINDYFSDGIFSKCDIIADNITINEKRQKKMDFVEVLPVKIIIVADKKHKKIFNYKELVNEKIIVAKGTSYYNRLEEISKQETIALNYVFAPDTASQIKMLLDGKGTITVLDSNLAALYLGHTTLGPFKAISAKQMIGWGHAKDHEETANKIKEFITKAEKTGFIKDTWAQYFGIPYSTYLTIAQ